MTVTKCNLIRLLYSTRTYFCVQRQYAEVVKVPQVPKNFLNLEDHDETSNFSALPLNENLHERLASRKMQFMSPVQVCAIPSLLEGRNVLLNTEIGGGKTLSYLVSLTNAFWEKSFGESSGSASSASPLAVILTPSRGNGQIIRNLASFLLKNSGYSVNLQFGGKDPSSVPTMQGGCDLLISNPVRIFELVSAKAISLDRCKFIVLDDVGAMQQTPMLSCLHEIFHKNVGALPDLQNRQTVIVGDGYVKAASSRFLPPDHVEFVQNAYSLPLSLKHVLLKTHGGAYSPSRLELLLENLRRNRGSRGIIFCNSVHIVKNLESELYNKGFNTIPYHSHLPNGLRNKAFQLFEKKQAEILVSTPMAQCVDFSSINFVINYQTPIFKSNFLHQIGRCGRLGQAGLAMTFMSKEDVEQYTKFILPFLLTNENVVPDFFKAHLKRKERVAKEISE